jgi:hypothetical protein
MDQTSFGLKRPSTSKVNSINPKKPKTSESVSEANPSSSLSLNNSTSEASSQVMVSAGKYKIQHRKKSIFIHKF